MQKPLPVLGQQPPLLGRPNQAVVNFSLPKENPWEQMQALVPRILGGTRKLNQK